MNRSTYLNRIRDARAHFLGNGEVPEGLLPESIRRSWRRCVQTGLATNLKTEVEFADQCLMSELRERNTSLLAQAQPEMENLYAHIMSTQSMVILSDSGGTILHAMGNPDFMSRAQRVALQPGVCWREEITGTNAIGTALVEKTPVFVGGAEHYFDRNTFLNCSASPILDPAGKVIGVLDISGDHRQPQEHTMALVRMSAQMIENRLFNVQFSHEVKLHFHSRPEFIGTLWEGIAVFSQEGNVLAVNRSGAFQLGLKGHSTGMLFEELFGMSFPVFLDNTRKATSSKILKLHNGIQLHVETHMHQPTIRSSSKVATDASKVLPLDLLDTGDAAMHKVVTKAKLAMGHKIPILIEGETGTGKELLARAIHESGPRKRAPFVAINCASIPEGLIESELFGHEEGAFTGARRRGAMGRVQQAHGGTLFLDEIGEMPLSLQARLLRVIQEREVLPLGGNKPVHVDIAIIAATNCRLREEVANGEFREDLYYRLNGLRLALPALRDRTDLQVLIEYILEKELGRPDIIIEPAVLQLLQRHTWRGNIRQLSNLLRSAIIFMEGPELQLKHLPDDFMEELQEHSGFRGISQQPSSTDLASQETTLIQHALALHLGNMAAAARHLGISRATIYRKIKRLGLQP